MGENVSVNEDIVWHFKHPQTTDKVLLKHKKSRTRHNFYVARQDLFVLKVYLKKSIYQNFICMQITINNRPCITKKQKIKKQKIHASTIKTEFIYTHGRVQFSIDKEVV